MSKLPFVKSDIPRDLRSFIDRVKEILSDAGNGRFVTADELVNRGIAGYGTDGNLVPTISGTTPVLGTPPAPTNVAATGALANVILSWDNPSYYGHAYAEVWGASSNNLANAVILGTSPGATYVDSIGSGTTRYYWVRFVNIEDTIGPYQGTSGVEGETGQDPAYLLELLTGQITESQLFADLGERIDLIDAPATTANSVAARIQAEASVRAQAILDEAALRVANDGALQTQINVLAAASTGDLQDLIAALEEEQTARITADTAEATARTTLATQLRGDYDGTDPNLLVTGILFEEKTARVNADTALSTSVTALSSTVEDLDTTLTAAITTEATTRATETAALSTTLTNVSATASSKNKTYYQNDAPTEGLVTGDIWFDTNDSNKSYRWNGTEWQLTADTRIASNAAAITAEATARATADEALSTTITTVSAVANAKNKTFYQNDAPTEGLTTGDVWFDTNDNNKSYRWNGTEWQLTADTRIASNAAAITAESSARATADDALSTTINTVSAVASGKNKTYYQNDAPASGLVTGDIWFDTNDANKSYRWNGTEWQLTADTRIADNAAAIVTEATARATGDSANATLITQVQARLDTGDYAAVKTESSTTATTVGGIQAKYTVKVDTNGYVSGYGLISTANNATPTSEFAVRADKFYVASPSGPGITPAVPFIVRTTETTINGVTVPVGVYITDGFIQNGTITNAKIGNAAIDDAKIASVTAGKITAGSIGVGEHIQSNNYVAGSQGWKIHGNGFAEFSSASIRGQLTASQIDTRNLTIKDAAGNVLFGSGTALSTANITGLGSLATKNTVAAATDVTGLGTLATKNTVDAAVDVTGLGTLATQNSVNWNTQLINIPAFGGFAYLNSITSANISSYIDGAAIGTAYIANAAISSAKIADAAITSAKINDAAITSAKIADAAITSAKIGDAAITSAKIGDLQVNSAKIANLSVGTIKIGNNAVTTASSAYTASAIEATSDTTWTDAQSLSFTTSGERVFISVTSNIINGIQNPTGDDPVVYYPQARLLRDSTVLVDMGTVRGPFAISYSESPPSGTYTYKLQLRGEDTADTNPNYPEFSQRSIFAIETKR